MNLKLIEEFKTFIVRRFLENGTNSRTNFEEGLLLLIQEHYVSLCYFDVIRRDYDRFVYEDDFLNLAPWNKIQRYGDLSEGFLGTFKEHINWMDLLYYTTLSEDFMDRHMDFFFEKKMVHHLPVSQNISEALVRKHKNKFTPMDWRVLCRHKRFSEDFIDEFKDSVDWPTISCCYDLQESFIERHIDRIDWYWILTSQALPSEFLWRHHDATGFNWDIVSMRQVLDTDFIFQFADFLNWGTLVEFQSLSRAVIRAFHERMDWARIIQNQKVDESIILQFADTGAHPWDSDYIFDLVVQYQSGLSDGFLEHFSDRLNWVYVFKYQKHLSSEFKNKHLHRLM